MMKMTEEEETHLFGSPAGRRESQETRVERAGDVSSSETKVTRMRVGAGQVQGSQG